MTLYLDTSVLVAALVEDEPHHEACLRLLRRRSLVTWTHALAETFSTLTGGRLGFRVSPATAATLIEESLVPRIQLLELDAPALRDALSVCSAVGVRGGALYDFLHMVTARGVGASVLYTLNDRHFIPLRRTGDPRIETPAIN